MPGGRFCYFKLQPYLQAWRPDHHFHFFFLLPSPKFTEFDHHSFLHRVPVNLCFIYTSNSRACRGFKLRIKQLIAAAAVIQPASMPAMHASLLALYEHTVSDALSMPTNP